MAKRARKPGPWRTHMQPEALYQALDPGIRFAVRLKEMTMVTTPCVEEAQAWLRGDRSSWNAHAQATDDRNHAFARCAEQDAAECQRAYWILRAHAEGLLRGTA